MNSRFTFVSNLPHWARTEYDTALLDQLLRNAISDPDSMSAATAEISNEEEAAVLLAQGLSMLYISRLDAATNLVRALAPLGATLGWAEQSYYLGGPNMWDSVAPALAGWGTNQNQQLLARLKANRFRHDSATAELAALSFGAGASVAAVVQDAGQIELLADTTLVAPSDALGFGIDLYAHSVRIRLATGALTARDARYALTYARAQLCGQEAELMDIATRPVALGRLCSAALCTL